MAALQLLYQRAVGGAAEAELDEAVHDYWVEHPAPETRRVFATMLVQGAIEAQDRIDPLIETAADNWRLSRMAVVDRMILRLAVYELLAAVTPPAVVIDEALELAKTFSGEQSVRFVNGVLQPTHDVLTAAARRGDLPSTIDIEEAAALLASPILSQHIMLRTTTSDALITNTTKHFLLHYH